MSSDYLDHSPEDTERKRKKTTPLENAPEESSPVKQSAASRSGQKKKKKYRVSLLWEDPKRVFARTKFAKRWWSIRLRRLVPILLLILILVLILSACSKHRKKVQAAEEAAIVQSEQEAEVKASHEASRQARSENRTILQEAADLAVGYNYDGALELLEAIPNYEQYSDVTAAIDEYYAIKDTLVLVDPSTVTHIFYHSLVVDPEKAFSGDDSLTAGFKQWMTTVDEFNKITQTMYDEGYVLISLYDIIEETVDEDGVVHTSQKELYLPPDKKAFILSLDDLSYYHSYDDHGIASKMVLDENGKPTCEYIQDDGTVVTGAYDCVPLLDAFLEEHPDGCYNGARGTIALTGYDGILGYRTDIAYKTRENLDLDQEVWLDEHPDFDWDEEREEAKKVADALKAEGWTFASHTWGHIKVGNASLEWLETDTEKWMTYVEPLVGETDIIIFAHGQDLATVSAYTSSEKFIYLKSQGFNIFCPVDSYQYTLTIEDTFAHDGRRNLDGYRLWNDAHGYSDWTSDLFDASEILDSSRTDMPAL